MAEKRGESSPAGGPQLQQHQCTPCPDSGGGMFEIRVSGHLDDSWSEWLDGLAMQRLENGDMILSGCIADQAALMGILNKLNRLNLALLSVRELKPRRKGKSKRSSGGNRIHE